MTGLPILLGDHRSPHATYIQGSQHYRDGFTPGDTGERIPSRLPVEVRSGVRRANSAHRNLQRAVQIEVRLARWLLMAQDRIQDDTLPLTHEFVSLMLAVRRKRPGAAALLGS